jgi:hypothetical protein
MYPVDEYQTTKNGKKFKISIGKMKYTDKKGKYDWHYNVKCQQKIGSSSEELKQDYWFDDLKDANDKVYELMTCKDINDILGTEILKRFKLKIGW